MTRLRRGPLIHKIIENFNKTIEGDEQDGKRMYFISGHDHTVASILASLYPAYSTSNTRPAYASAAILELHSNMEVRVISNKSLNIHKSSFDFSYFSRTRLTKTLHIKLTSRIVQNLVFTMILFLYCLKLTLIKKLGLMNVGNINLWLLVRFRILRIKIGAIYEYNFF